MARRMLTVRLADELVDTLKQRAATDAIPVTELVARLLRQGLVQEQVDRGEDVAELAQRLKALEDRMEESRREIETHLLGRFETLENLFARMASNLISTR